MPLYPSTNDKTIIDLFCEQSRQTPDSPALMADARSMTYGELDARSSQLARYLTKRGVQPESLVPICIRSSLNTLVGVLGILKAGGAYVPIDPEHPAERIRFMLADIASPLVLTDRHMSPSLTTLDATLDAIRLDDDWSLIAHEQAGPVALPARLHNLAYVIYTSGSTGNPKGVLIEHRSIRNYILNSIQAYASPDTQQAGSFVHLPLSFDASLTALFVPLLTGKPIIIHTGSPLEAFTNTNLLQQSPLDFLKITPAQLFLIDSARQQQVPQLSKKYVVGGEALQPWQYKFLTDSGADVTIINEYGPTETTVGCITYTFHVSEDIPLYPNGVLIGRPMPHVAIYILNESLTPVPDGVEGEIFISGVQVARGYLNQDELTRQKFLPDPFSADSHTRMYRSGDLARRLPDGNLEYLGRKDEQVKLNGYRIELGEIEAVLDQYPGLTQCAVAAKEDADHNKRLVAYLVMEGPLDRKSVIDFLLARLPRYMVPQLLVPIDHIPLTRNGKVDKKALPNPDASLLLNRQSALAETGAEEQLVAIWKTVLNVSRVGRHDNFFALGGSSLLALKLVNHLREAFACEVPVTKLYQFPTVGELLAYLQGETKKLRTPIRPASSPAESQDVAVIGMAGRFPGANTIDELWAVLRDGRETIRFFSAEELDPSIPASKRNDPAYVKAKGVIDGADQFDAAFFGLNPRLAELMDPQHRVFLEIARDVLEQTGYLPDVYDGDIGVYAGTGYNTYFLHNVLANPWRVDQVGEFQVKTLNEKDYIASRVAYQLNLKGPAVSVHAACSTSLLAIAQAVESIRAGRCELALAGGASITSPLHGGHAYQEGSILSGDGHCRPFDAAAQGTVFSDGAGVVLLKSREAAQRDGDKIYAVIKGIGINNDGGGKGSFTAPSAEGQAGAIARALADAQVDPDSISYVETHGTATPLGDPIEMEGLTMAFGPQPTRQYCAIGSIKSNMGHLTTAAGVAGFIKTTLALHHKQLPASLWFSTPNPGIDFASSPFFVNTKLTDWSWHGPRRAGVSAFGIGGTNVHIVLEEAEAQQPKSDRETPAVGRPVQLVTWSAKSDASCDAYAQALASHIQGTPAQTLADVAFTGQTTRPDFSHRRFAVVASGAELAEALQTGSGHPAASATTIHQETPESLVFLFPGQGVQYLNMGRELYENEAVYRQAVDTCAELLLPYLETDIRQVMYPQTADAQADDRLKDPQYAQPALFITEYALAQLWISWGIKPTAFCGQSIGEFVAAHLAGVFALPDVLRLMAVRGQLVRNQLGGGMLSVRLGADQIRELLPDSLSIAVVNSPQLCVVSGPDEAIETFARMLDERGISNRKLLVSYASHSTLMDPIVDAFRAHVASVPLQKPQQRIISTVSGLLLTDAQATDPGYWADHLRMTVRFSDALASVVALRKPLLLEVGPGNVTAIIARQQVDISRIPVLATLETYNNVQSDYRSVLKTLGQLWQQGLKPDWQAFYAGQNRQKVKVPTYVYDKKRCWVDPVSVDTRPQPARQPVTVAPAEVVASEGRSKNRRDVLIQRLRTILENASGIDLSAMLPGQTFLEVGLDSLLLTNVAFTLQNEFGAPITFRQLNDECGTLGLLGSYLDKVLPADALPAPSREEPQPAAAVRPDVQAPADITAALTQVMQQLQVLTNEIAQLKAGGSVPSLLTNAAVLTPDREPRLPELPPAQRQFVRQLVLDHRQKTQRSRSYLEQHCPEKLPAHWPNTSALAELTHPLVGDHTEDGQVWDTDGNRYIDLVNGLGLHWRGNASPFSGSTVEQQTQLSRQVCQLLCDGTRQDEAALYATGQEALHQAIRMARSATGRQRVIVINQAPASEPTFATLPDAIEPIRLLPDQNPDEPLGRIQQQANGLAALVVQIDQNQRWPHAFAQFLKQISSVTAASGTVLIYDVNATGIRLHPTGTQALSANQADLLVYQKAMGNDLPLGAVVGKHRFLHAIEGSTEPSAGVSLIALKAANRFFEHMAPIDPTLQQKRTDLARSFAESINVELASRKLPLFMAQLGAHWRIQFTDTTRHPELLFALMRTKGIYLLPGVPCSLTEEHTDADVRQLKKILIDSASELAEAGFISRSANGQAVARPEPVRKFPHQPSLPDARLGRDRTGKPAWFMAHPNLPGTFLQIEF